MILKRLLLPIFLLVFGFQSCNEDNEINEVSATAYDKYNKIAFKWLEKQHYDSAFYYFQKARLVAQSSEEVVYCLLQIAAIEEKLCDFAGSEATATEAFERNTNPIYLPYIYNVLGIAYSEQNNFDFALEYYTKCYSYSFKKLDKAIVKNNISVVYLKKKDFNKAISILSKIITNDSLQADKKQYAKVLDNLGYAYFKVNSPKALPYLTKSLAMRTVLKNDFELIASYIHMAEYHQNGNTALALEFATKAYQSAKIINSPDDKIEALKFMIAISEPVAAKQLALKQIALTDSINRVRQSAKNQFAKIKYDSKNAQLEKQRYKQQKEWALVILVLVVILAIVLFYYIRYRNSKKLKASVYTTETRIAKKLHDELANDVFNAMTFAETQDLQNPEKKEALLDNLDTIYSRTRDISRDNSEINTGEGYRDFMLDLFNSYSNTAINVIINGNNTIDWNKVSKESKITLYRVLQELMVNMKKHSQASVVIIGFNNLPKHIEVKYTDNGKGITQTTKTNKMLLNAENRIHAIKGTITFETETNKGLRITITIPK